MKSLAAAILLLFQLQPVLGTVVCLGFVEKPAEECTMPEPESMPAENASAPMQMPPPNCALVAVCAPAPLAIPAFAAQLVQTVLFLATPAITAGHLPTDFSSAPPLPPPRA